MNFYLVLNFFKILIEGCYL